MNESSPPIEHDTSGVTWLGHSTTLIQTGGQRILTDPILRRRVAHLRRRSDIRPANRPQQIDAVLLSHLHLDHCDLPTLRRLGDAAPLIVPEGAAAWLRRRGLPHAEEIAVGETRQIGGMRVRAVPAVHSGHRVPFGPTTATIGYVIEGSHAIYFAGDTDLFDDMSSLGAQIDLALIPVWGWGRTLGAGHLDPERAARAVSLIQPRLAVPIHWGTFHPYGTGIRDRRFLTEPAGRFADFARVFAPEVDIRIAAPGDLIRLS
ncbi:MAG: MBL fold metallo-hydrolase [Thermomicrobiales bacterium]|nr:MBL fold metallo-hydrolase [Thermomicrobiales bacterium]